MSIDHASAAARLALAPFALMMVAGCTQGLVSGEEPVASFGDANRQTMMLQVLDPEPEYETPVHAGSGQRAADAVERYNEDRVKKPVSVTTSDSSPTSN